MDSRTLYNLATNPQALMRLRTTGHLPAVRNPSSPLITLLQTLHPRERLQITGVTVGSSLGYTGCRRFHNAQQVLNWLVPPGDHSRVASESWQDKRFQRELGIDDLAKVASVPKIVAEGWCRRNPQKAKRVGADQA
ncbi:hypothetical protein FEV13_00015 (plasmid) [Stutzerimonas degradans]|nr:hypothetical protein FEV13_00015 [Stutzerimonas degradans]